MLLIDLVPAGAVRLRLSVTPTRNRSQEWRWDDQRASVQLGSSGRDKGHSSERRTFMDEVKSVSPLLAHVWQGVIHVRNAFFARISHKAGYG